MPSLLVRLLLSIPESGDIQVIVVDDCSPCAKTMLSEFPQLNRTNVEYYYLAQNGGGGKARNEGLKYAKGTWLLFADSDDFFSTDFVSLLDENYNTEADVVYFNVLSVESDDVSKSATRNRAKELLFEKYRSTGEMDHFRYSYCEPWGKMVRRDLVEKNHIRFDETKVANDYFFSVVSGCLATSVDVCDRHLYVLTRRNNSVSSGFANTDEKLLIRLDVYTKVQLFLQSRNLDVKPMPIRGLMVILMKRNFLEFLRRLSVLRKKNISIVRLLSQMFDVRYILHKKI